MALIDDLAVVNNAGTPGDWTVSNFDAVGASSGQPTPNHVEGTDGAWWTLKKDTTGYTYTSTISGTPSMTGRILVGFINYAFADIDAIPITAIGIRVSSSTGFTTNYGEVNALAQIQAPENTPISGHTPVILYEDNATESGSPNYGTVESVGWTATTGGTNDGKQGGFDWFFIIGYIGAHSQTFTDTFLSDLRDEYYDSNGGGLPGTTSRPIAVFSQAGDFFQSNIRLQLGHGTSDTANVVVTETAKTIFFNNLHVNHELGWIFVNPSSSHEIRLTLTSCVMFWNDQASGNEIFDGITNVDHFKITACSFFNGGQISLPADTANRWVRGSTFSSCQAGTASDGEFTTSIVSGGLTMTVSGDADFTGTQFLEPAVAADASALVWNGNFDPDGNLDDMSFSKGTNAHHAIAFGTATPTTMTLRDIAFTGFTNTIGNNATPLHILRTSGTVTINLIGCTGVTADGYKTAGATVSLVVSPVITLVKILDGRDNSNLQNARVILKASDGAGDLPYLDSVTITRAGTVATVSHTAHGLATANKVEIKGITDKTEDNNGPKTITVTTANAYTYVTTDSGSTSYTGSITSTGVVIEGLTDASGEISDTRTWGLAQNVTGRAAKSTASPFFRDGPLTGTISTTLGLSITQALTLDE